MESLDIGRYLKRLTRTRFEHHDAGLAFLGCFSIDRECSSQPVVSKTGNSSRKCGESPRDSVTPSRQILSPDNAVETVVERDAAKTGKQFIQAWHARVDYGQPQVYDQYPRKNSVEILKALPISDRYLVNPRPVRQMFCLMVYLGSQAFPPFIRPKVLMGFHQSCINIIPRVRIVGSQRQTTNFIEVWCNCVHDVSPILIFFWRHRLLAQR